MVANHSDRCWSLALWREVADYIDENPPRPPQFSFPLSHFQVITDRVTNMVKTMRIRMEPRIKSIWDSKTCKITPVSTRPHAHRRITFPKCQFLIANWRLPEWKLLWTVRDDSALKLDFSFEKARLDSDCHLLRKTHQGTPSGLEGPLPRAPETLGSWVYMNRAPS